MSPLWRDEVGIFLGPRGAVLTRLQRGLRPRSVADRTLAVADGRPNDWSQALAAARSELQDPSWQRANARVVIADLWVRYAIAPWSRDLVDDDERLAHGKLILQQVYGDEMRDWTVRLAETVARRAQLVCAIPSQLKSDVDQVLATAGLRLLSLQPHLVVAFNRWRSRMSAAGGWFVTIDDGSLAAVRLERDSWEEVHCVRVGDDWSADLRRLQTFGRLACGPPSDGCSVLVDAPPWLRRVASARSEGLEWLESDGDGGGTLETLARIKESHA